VRRLEPALIGLFLASWLGALLGQLSVLALAGSLPLGLYPFYSLAAALGWVAGNVYVHRRRRVPAPLWRRLLLIYLVGPPGILYLVREMAPAADQALAPLVPLLGFAVFGVFFAVPVTLAPPSRR
jgi:hypothetical protein